jgi:hypothetical protein
MKVLDKPRPRHLVGGADLGQDRGSEAKKLAAAILEVLAGVRTPTEAAAALALSVQHYYKVETRALQGLLAACEPRPKGRVRTAATELAELGKENQRLTRELARQQALARAAQRAMGLSPPPAGVNQKGKKPRRRRVARALSVAQRLKEQVTAGVDSATLAASAEAV